MMYSPTLVKTIDIINEGATMTNSQVEAIGESLMKAAILEFRNDNLPKDISRLSFHVRAIGKFIDRNKPIIKRKVLL